MYIYRHRVGREYINWVGGSSRENYFQMFKAKSVAQTIAAFKQHESMIPWNLLRCGGDGTVIYYGRVVDVGVESTQIITPTAT